MRYMNHPDSRGIWMLKDGSSLCLRFEAAQCLRVWREPVRKELQGNDAVEALSTVGRFRHTGVTVVG